MPLYAYDAFTADGQKISGEIFAESDVFALEQLVRQRLVPVSISDRVRVPWWYREIGFGKDSGSVAQTELERFFSVLASLARARFPLARAIGFAGEQARGRRMKRVLVGAKLALENGETLSAALASGRGAIPDSYLALIAVGERANRLEATATAISRQLATEGKLAQEFRGALIYPAILLAMSVVVISVVTFYLAPTLLPVFASGGAEAPRMLAMMAAAGAFAAANWALLLGMLFAMLVALWVLRTSIPAVTLAAGLRLPLVGRYLRQRETLRMLQAILMMLAGGAQLTAALDAAAGAATISSYRQLAEAARTRIEAGGTLSDTFAQAHLIDDLARVMIAAGEEGDRLNEMLAGSVEILAADTARTLSQAVRALTPILTLVIGGFVAMVILTTISAIMDLNDIAF